MRIERIHIQGFKTIENATIEGLSAINVFFGMNDVGKSNIFEALDLWFWLLSEARSPKGNMSLEKLNARFRAPLFQLNRTKPILVELNLLLDRQDLPDDLSSNSPAVRLQSQFVRSNKEQLRLVCQIEIEKAANEIAYQVVKNWDGGNNFDLHPKDLSSVLGQFHTIHANRRLQAERRVKGNGTIPITYQNLKQALFYAYLSSDPRQKKRLEAIRRILSEPPFGLGQLDIALDPESDEIDIGFMRADGRLPIESLGSGSQQLLLVLGQIFLNDSPLVALEEPEMNLSPQYQQHLLTALRRLMQDPAIALDQLFISTHSPYLEFAENFYDVTLDKQGHTQIVRAAPQEHARHFAIAPLGPETGARLNSLNQVQLYKDVLDDLHLQRGDMVFFVKDEAGRWEIHPENEIIGAMETAWSDTGGDE